MFKGKKYLFIKGQMNRMVVMFIMSCLLTACSSQGNASDLRVSTKPTVVFRITWDEYSGRGEVMSRLVSEFNGISQKGYVELVGGNEDFDDVMSGLEEDIADVYVLPYRYVQHPQVYEELEPLTRTFSDDWSSYYDTVVDMVTVGDEKMALPWIGHSMCLIFNGDLIRQADVNPHLWASPQELLEGLDTIEEKTGKAGIALVGAEHHDLSWMVNQFVYTFGGELVSFDEEGNPIDIVVNSEEAAAGIDYYINGLGAYAQPGWEEHNGSDVLEVFANGEAAFEIQGPWAVSDIWKRGNPFEIGVVPLSQLGIYAEVGPLMLALDKDSDNMSGALEFMQFLNTDKAQEILMNGEYDDKYGAYYPFRVPIKTTVVESEFFKQYTEFKAFVAGFEMPSLSTPDEIWAVKEEQYISLLHQVIIGDMTIEDALEEIDP